VTSVTLALYTRVQSFFTGKSRKSFNYKKKEGMESGKKGEKSPHFNEMTKFRTEEGKL